MIFVNFKTYEQGTGTSGIALTRILETVSFSSQVKIIPVVQAADVAEITQISKLEIWVQHIDPVGYGPHTGYVVPEAVFEDGAMGTFLNHSEHKFERFEDIKRAQERAKEAGLKTLIFAANLEELKQVILLSPTYVSYEPPELVGSKSTSVAKAMPEVISKAADITRDNELPLIVGAGIKSAEDVRKSLELGAVGVAVASDVVTSKDPRGEILDLVEGFK